MNSDNTVSKEQEINQVSVHKPHIVLLGAGASLATCLDGDRNGRTLPLMANFSESLGLTDQIETWGIDSNQNFELIFSNLYQKQEHQKLRIIKDCVYQYFRELELPDTPTIYDYLVLSLRSTDLIATFNWDPLLLQAFKRNRIARLDMPKLIFLHGNTLVGFCESHNEAGYAGLSCSKCGQAYKATELLYPIADKNYNRDNFIAREWHTLRSYLPHAFMLTVFGYSAPNYDTEAASLMKAAWGETSQRDMEQLAFITIQSEDEIDNTWKEFIHTHHREIHADFHSSWIANHPRRTGEAHWNQYYLGKFIDNNPLPQNLDFPELWAWFEQFKAAEAK